MHRLLEMRFSETHLPVNQLLGNQYAAVRILNYVRGGAMEIKR